MLLCVLFVPWKKFRLEKWYCVILPYFSNWFLGYCDIFSYNQQINSRVELYMQGCLQPSLSPLAVMDCIMKTASFSIDSGGKSCKRKSDKCWKLGPCWSHPHHNFDLTLKIIVRTTKRTTFLGQIGNVWFTRTGIREEKWYHFFQAM